MKINLEFNIRDKVKIIELNVKGRVISIWITEQGIKYEVRYFDEEKAKTVYFYSDELEKGV